MDESSIDSVINQAIQRSVVFNILNVFQTNTTQYNQNINYFNQPPVGGYLVNEQEEYVLRDSDDLSSMIFLDIVTRFGSPGSYSLNDKYKEYRKDKIRNTCKYKKIKDSDSLINQQCPICIDNFCCGEYQRTLECSHVFHRKCIDRWFKKGKNDCPMCRTKII
jgi:hypothetical protein